MYVDEGEGGGGGGGGGGEEDTNNMCREILVEPLSDFSR